MEELKPIKEVLKQSMKTQLRGTISSSLERHSVETLLEITNATNKVTKDITDWVWDKDKIAQISKAAQEGASYVAVRVLIDKTTQDAVEQAAPQISAFLELMRKTIIQAASEAISEIISEEMGKMKEKYGK